MIAPIIAPARAGDVSARQGRKLPLDRAFDSTCEFGAVGDQDRLRRGVMFGLRQKIGGDPLRIAGRVGDDQNFGRPGDHVDADDAEDPALGRRDIGVAGTDDLRDRRDARRAIGQRRDRLRAADAVDLIDAGKLGRCQNERIDMPIRRRDHHDQAGHPCHFRRDRVHEHRGGIARRAARHVEAGRFDRLPAPAEFDAERIGEHEVLRPLLLVKGGDPLMRQTQRRQRLRRRGRFGCGDVLRRNRQTQRGKIDAIEFQRIIDERRIAARDHIGDDLLNRLIDVFGPLALRRKKSFECLVEIFGPPVEPCGIIVSLPRGIPP